MPFDGLLQDSMGRVALRKRFARGPVTTAPMAAGARRPFYREELNRFVPLQEYWERRERRALEGAGGLDYGLCVQVADAVEFAKDESRRWWLPYAYIDKVTDWRDRDAQDLDALFERVRTETGLDPDEALQLSHRAGDIQLPWYWRGGSPTIAAGFEDTARGAWLANHRRGRDEQHLTAWVWLCAAYLDVPWDATPCTWCGEPYPLTSAMAHVAGRVVGREVARDDLGHIYGKAGVGGAAFALQMVANEFACGLFGDDACRDCPLVEGCTSCQRADFPFE